MRVVSLLPSATEIASRIGAQGLLVARSHECDYPPAITDLPALTSQRTHFDPAAGTDAAEIDRQVKAAGDAGTALYHLDVAALGEINPDVILTQDLCDVCSIDLATVRSVAGHLLRATGRAPQIVSLNPETIEGMLDDHLTVGQAIGMTEKARAAVVELRDRLFRAEEHVPAFSDGPVVGFMEWTDPVFVAGHWNVQLIERAGGRHPLNETVARPEDGAAIGPQRGQRIAGKSIAVPTEVFAATNPEVLIIAPCGLTLEQGLTEAQRLRAHDWFNQLPAVRTGRACVVDGSQMFNRPGPRLVDAFEFLVGYLNDRPELIPADFPWALLET